MSPSDGWEPIRRPKLRVINAQPKAARGGSRGTWSPWISVLAVVLHFLLRLLLDPWLNASSNWKFRGAVLALVLPLALAGFALYRAIIPRRPG